MAENSPLKHIGSNTGMSGNERTMYQHATREDLLIGIEHKLRNPEEMYLYRLTNNIFRAMFPNNFPRVVRAGTAEERSYAVVTKAEAVGPSLGQQYIDARDRFDQTIGVIFPEGERKDILHKFGFFDERGKDNLLVAPDGNPIYVDKIDPHILLAIDLDLLDSLGLGSRKTAYLKHIISKTRNKLQENDRRRDELERMLEQS